MAKPSKDRARKKKRREKELRRARNVRSNLPAVRDDDAGFDFDSALEALPLEVQVERVMRRMAHATGRRRFASSNEAMAALGDLDDASRSALQAEDPLETAQDCAFLALDPANEDVAPDLVDEALELDPQCVDALALRAWFDSPDDGAQIRGIQRAILVAEERLGGAEFRARNETDLWCDVLARPYLRARRLLSNRLFSRGLFAEAIVEMEALLGFDRSDPLHVRESLVAALLARDDRARARALIDELAPEQPGFVAWARPLERWLANDRDAARDALAQARASHPRAEERILAPVELHDDADLNDEDADRAHEAKLIGLILERAWSAHPDAREWLEHEPG